jgi:hypothetical protein
VNNEFEKIWKEAAEAYLPEFCLEGTQKILKISVRISGDPTEVRTQHLSTTNLDLYRCANLFVAFYVTEYSKDICK